MTAIFIHFVRNTVEKHKYKRRLCHVLKDSKTIPIQNTSNLTLRKKAISNQTIERQQKPTIVNQNIKIRVSKPDNLTEKQVGLLRLKSRDSNKWRRNNNHLDHNITIHLYLKNGHTISSFHENSNDALIEHFFSVIFSSVCFLNLII